MNISSDFRFVAAAGLVSAAVAMHFHSTMRAGEQPVETDKVEFEEPAKLTPLGQAVLDRAMAESLIAYGLRVKNPEAIVAGVQILYSLPIQTVRNDLKNASEESEDKRLQTLLDQSVKMRPADELLANSVERARQLQKARELLTGPARSLVEGLKSWTVTIRPGGYFQLDPKLRFEQQQEAIVDARVVGDQNGQSADGTLGISVRGGNLSRAVQASGDGTVACRWNASLYESGWIVKIYNLEKRPMTVKVTAY